MLLRQADLEWFDHGGEETDAKSAASIGVCVQVKVKVIERDRER
jgi:hypothetical protein